jgi:hypothetical protein
LQESWNSGNVFDDVSCVKGQSRNSTQLLLQQTLPLPLVCLQAVISRMSSELL